MRSRLRKLITIRNKNVDKFWSGSNVSIFEVFWDKCSLYSWSVSTLKKNSATWKIRMHLFLGWINHGEFTTFILTFNFSFNMHSARLLSEKCLSTIWRRRLQLREKLCFHRHGKCNYHKNILMIFSDSFNFLKASVLN